MKHKFLYRIFIMTCILLFLNGCTTKKIPAIKFANPIYNFGETAEGSDVTYTFTFLNSGTDTLKITSVRPTCGCTVVGRFAREVAPGKSGDIPVVFKTKGFEGYVSKTIRVETNIPESEPIILSMEGKINLIIKVDPDNVWLGQTRANGPPLTKTISVKNYVDTPLKIIKIKPSGENCTTKVNTIEEGKEYTIDITVSPPFKMNQVKETLDIMTNIEGRELIKVKYQYYGVSDIEVSPEEIIISTKYLQPDLKRIITVKSNNNTTFSIINSRILNGDNMELTITEVMPGKHIQLVLYFTEKFEFQENKIPTVSFSIKSNHGEREYTIPILNADNL